jgi:membrane-associated protease RseP (regulator of RpoE activity)
VAKLAAVVAVAVAVGYAAGYGDTVLILLALILCIVAHEAGHFLAARTGGVKVSEFFVGFGPRLWSVRRGETEYGVKALPLGGYCRILGMNNLEEVDPAEERRTYRAASLGRRLAIDVAGSAAHFLIALVVLFAMFALTGTFQGNYLDTVPADNPVVAIVALRGGPSPAEAAGFQVGDRIEAINGIHFATWDQQARFIQTHPGERLDVTVDRHGRVIHLYPTPVAADSVRAVGALQLPAGPVGFIGLDTSAVIHPGLAAAVGDAGGAFAYMAGHTFGLLGHLVTLSGLHSYFSMLSSQKAAASSSSGQLVTIVALPSVVHAAAQSGLPEVLWLVALINLSIGIINLLPFFPFDGGRVVVALYEGVRGWRRPGYRVDMNRALPAMSGIAVVLFVYVLGWMLINVRSLS